MPPEKAKRKLAFFEVDRGRLGECLQEDFEEAQKIAAERGVEVKINAQITVFPPDQKDPMYGSVQYKHSISQPAFLSRKYDTVLNNDGMIISDAEQPLEQLDLDLEIKKDPKLIPHPSTGTEKE